MHNPIILDTHLL